MALQFLTIMPLGKRLEITEADMQKSITAFPLVGFIQGVLLVGTVRLSEGVFPADLTAAFVLLVYVVSNGGFHLDGLSDTFDAIAKRGDREEKLKAMKDSSSGAAGVTAVVFSILLKYLSLKALAVSSVYYLSALLMPVVSKWAMLVAMHHGKAARKEGLGKIFIEGTGTKKLIVTALMVFILTTGATMVLSDSQGFSNHVFNAVAVMVILYIFGFLATGFYKRRFGGLTGDTLGATSELSEIIFLLVVLSWSRLYI